MMMNDITGEEQRGSLFYSNYIGNTFLFGEFKKRRRYDFFFTRNDNREEAVVVVFSSFGKLVFYGFLRHSLI